MCVHCARRKTACIPQGEIHDQNVLSAQESSAQICEPRLDDSLLFLESLDRLRQRVVEALADNHQPFLGDDQSPIQAPREPEIMQGDCAPVMNLLNHRLIPRQSRRGDPREARKGGDSHEPHKLDTQEESSLPIKHAEAIHKMCAVLPPGRDIVAILENRSEWWETWRESFGLAWGEEQDKTLAEFAIRAVRAGNPSLLGSLLICFAFSTSDFSRYIPHVEYWILSDDRFIADEYDLQCLMGLGLCLFSALQPRRAWLAYRKANALLQLAGVHRMRQRSEAQDQIFWQIFGADRWLSLLIGLPYSVPDHLCDLSILPINQSSPIKFHYQSMTVLTGRVIDCLQSPRGFSLSIVIGIEEEIDKITAQLPPDYLNMAHINTCSNKEKTARIYRILQIHQLKTFMYLSLFLQYCDACKQKLAPSPSALYGRTACISNARLLLDGYLALYDIDPSTATVDNSMKLSSFTALAAAVVLFLNLLAGSHTAADASAPDLSTAHVPDGALINRTIAVFRTCSEGQSQSLCGQCHSALQGLVSCIQGINRGDSQRIVIPYFGVVELTRSEVSVSSHIEQVEEYEESRPTSTGENLDLIGCAPNQNMTDILDLPNVFDDMLFSYYGPWESNESPSLLFGQALEGDPDGAQFAYFEGSR